MTKYIISDVDGVLLDWETHFHEYMRSHGHERAYDGTGSYWKEDEYSHLGEGEARRMVYHFNTSAWMLELPTWQDARVGVARLSAAGYRFIAVTAMGTDPYAKKVRQICLDNTFGKGVFEGLITTDMYDPNSKRPTLEKLYHPGRIWIEDKPSNAVIGREIGYDTYLISHKYNEYFDEAAHGITRVNSWATLCGKLLEADQSSSP